MAEIKFVGTKVTVRNGREQDFLNILNEEITRIYRYWIDDAEWRRTFEVEQRSSCFLFEHICGELSAMFFMGMIEEPVSGIDVFWAIEKEVEEYDRRNEW